MHIAATLMIAILIVWPSMLKADELDEVIDYLVAHRRGEQRNEQQEQRKAASSQPHGSANSKGELANTNGSATPTK